MRVNQGIRRRGRTAFAVCLIVAAALVTPAIAGARTTSTFHLTARSALRKVRVAKGPQQIRVLTLSPGANVPDIAPATEHYPMWALTSTMSAHAGAIAGINGDFGTGEGQPSHTLMIDGELWTTGQSGGDAAAWSANGKRAYIGHPAIKILAQDLRPDQRVLRAGLEPRLPSGGRDPGLHLARRHRDAAARQDASAGRPTRTIARAARADGGDPLGRREPHFDRPALPGGRAAQVVPTDPAWAWQRELRRRRFEGDVAHGAKIRALQPGDHVRISWAFRGWRGVTDVMGASQILVKKGANVAPGYNPGDNYILNYNPRTAVGITKGCSDVDRTTSCRMIFMTIDGRQSSTGWSKGVRLPYLAGELIRAGAYRAVNLDGGGSTTMWARKRASAYCESSPSAGGCLVQRPSPSTGERATRSAIVVLPSADAGTPSGLR